MKEQTGTESACCAICAVLILWLVFCTGLRAHQHQLESGDRRRGPGTRALDRQYREAFGPITLVHKGLGCRGRADDKCDLTRRQVRSIPISPNQGCNMMRPVRAFSLFFILLFLMVISPAFAQDEPVIYADPVRVSVSGNGQYTAAGSGSGAINYFDRTGLLLWAYPTDKWITGVSASSDGEYVVAAGVDPIDASNGTIYCFDRRGLLLWSSDPDLGIKQAAISADGNSIVAVGYDTAAEPVMYSFDNTGNIRWKSTGSTYGASGIALSNDADRIAVGTWGGGGSPNRYDGSIRLFSGNGTMLGKYGTQSWLIGIAISGDGSSVAGIDRNVVYLLDGEGRLLWNYTSRYETLSVAISADGRHVAAGSQYKIMYLNQSGALLWEIMHEDYVNGIAISADGQSVLAGTGPRHYAENGTVYSIDGSGKTLWSHRITGGASSVSVSDNGDLNAAGLWYTTGKNDPRIHIYDRSGNDTGVILNTSHFISPVKQATTPAPGSPSPSPTDARPAPLTTGIIIGTIPIAVFLTGRRQIRDDM